jgi:hypothetical protein
MKSFLLRIKSGGKAAAFHFLGSLLLGCLSALVVFLFWYPHPYGQLSGGRNLFGILVAVDVICGPLLTWIIYNPAKPKRELILDMSLVILIQLGALAYGLYTAYIARPIYLVHEIDRFRVVSVPDFGDVDVSKAISALPVELHPKLWGGPITVGIRLPENKDERKNVLFESMYGGRDYAQRPEYYVPFDSSYQQALISRSKSLDSFTKHFPTQTIEATEMARSSGVSVSQMRFLPVLHKQEWIAVLKPTGEIAGFLPGDGFSVP